MRSLLKREAPGCRPAFRSQLKIKNSASSLPRTGRNPGARLRPHGSIPTGAGLAQLGLAPEVGDEPAGDRRGPRARRPGVRRAAGGALARELRRPRKPCLARSAGGCGEGWALPQPVPAGPGTTRGPGPGRRRGQGDWPGKSEHRDAGVRRCGTVVGRRDQRRAVRGRAWLQLRAWAGQAAARDDGGGLGGGRHGAGPRDRAAVRGRGCRRPYIPARAGEPARVGRARACQRPRRPREHERVDDRGSASARRRGRASRAAEGDATGRRASPRGHGPTAGSCHIHRRADLDGRRKGRPRSDG